MLGLWQDRCEVVPLGQGTAASPLPSSSLPLLSLISFPFISKNSLCLSHPSFSHSLSRIHSEPANGVCSNSVLLDRAVISINNYGT